MNPNEQKKKKGGEKKLKEFELLMLHIIDSWFVLYYKVKTAVTLQSVSGSQHSVEFSVNVLAFPDCFVTKVTEDLGFGVRRRSLGVLVVASICRGWGVLSVAQVVIGSRRGYNRNVALPHLRHTSNNL